MSERETALKRILSQLSFMVINAEDRRIVAAEIEALAALPPGDAPQTGSDPVPMCQWREIATAPKDGTRILLTPAVWTAKKVVSAYYRLGLWWVESADVRGSMRAFTDPDDDASHWPFTHWMPLPAPPAALVPAEGEKA